MTLFPINPSISTKPKNNFIESTVYRSNTGPLLKNPEKALSATAISILVPLNYALQKSTQSQPQALDLKKSCRFIKELESFDNPEIHADPLGYIYLFTNEENLNSTASFLRETPKVSNGCHIGFSGMHNFDIMALRKSAYGLICDCNKNSTAVLQDILKILRESPTRENFIENLFSILDTAIKKEGSIFKGIQFQKALVIETTNPNSWLSNNESFHHIRNLALEEKICLITEDARNSKTFEKISQKLREKKIPLDTLYLSNISNYILDNEKRDRPLYEATVKALVEDTTISINCPLPPFIPSPYWSPESHSFHYRKHISNRSVIQHVFTGKAVVEELLLLKKRKTAPRPIEENSTEKASTNQPTEQFYLESSEEKAIQLQQKLGLDAIFRQLTS